jgi:protein Mpv17
MDHSQGHVIVNHENKKALLIMVAHRGIACWLVYFLIGRSIVSASGFLQSSSSSVQDRIRILRGGQSMEPRITPESNFVKSLVSQLGSVYSENLSQRPILTKSLTAGFIFCLSDYIAQRSTASKFGDNSGINRTRLAVSAAVGLFYFGPAAHYWYDWMFHLFPATNLPSTLAKAAMGQTLFGPTFTCIFFATGLWQAGQLSWTAYAEKIRRDLPKTWVAGAGFWITVDLISYSYLPVKYIPLFVNVASLIWTTYLVIKSYGGDSATARRRT